MTNPEWKAGDVVVLRNVPARPDRPYEPGTRIAKIRSLEAAGAAVALRIGAIPMRSGGCRFASKTREVKLDQIVRLATRREIVIGAISVVVPMAVAS